MVRFIIMISHISFSVLIKIYIPIWLDLLFLLTKHYNIQFHYLHSNMVRFIIKIAQKNLTEAMTFTFQYG